MLRSVIRDRPARSPQPASTLDTLGIHERDTIITEVKDSVATLLPVRRSYAGALTGAYGHANEYAECERES